MIHSIRIPMGDQNRPGIAKFDARARQREADNPQNRDTAFCQCCGGQSTSEDLWKAQWAYSFTPNKVIGFLAVIVAFTGVGIIQYTRTLFHTTCHTICPECARSAMKSRLFSLLLSYVGLFLSLLGLGLALAIGAWYLMASNPHDQALAQNWIAWPIISLVVGIAIVRVARRFRLPAALRPLLSYPFRLTALRRVHN